MKENVKKYLQSKWGKLHTKINELVTKGHFPSTEKAIYSFLVLGMDQFLKNSPGETNRAALEEEKKEVSSSFARTNEDRNARRTIKLRFYRDGYEFHSTWPAQANAKVEAIKQKLISVGMSRSQVNEHLDMIHSVDNDGRIFYKIYLSQEGRNLLAKRRLDAAVANHKKQIGE